MENEQSSKEAVEKQLREDRELIRRVFSSTDGQTLLQKWAATHIWANQLHQDPHILYARIGQQEFVTSILNCMGDVSGE